MPVSEGNHRELFSQQDQLEREFFTSLSNLANVYKFSLPDVSEKPFPYNVAYAYREAKEVLKEINPNLNLFIVQDEHRLACISTILNFDTGTILYYIPIRPLVDLLKFKKRQPVSDLILSIFSYLYQIVKIPYHRDNYSYLYYVYDVMTEWYVETGDWSRDEVKHHIQEINAMKKKGDVIHKMISAVIHLNEFNERLARFVPTNSFESELLEIANRIYSLWKSHPKRSIFDNIPEGLFNPEIEERVNAESYISFFWDSNGLIYDNLMEYVNSDFQECGVIEEPVSIQFFDTIQTGSTHDLSFETSLFALFEDLCTVLNKLQ